MQSIWKRRSYNYLSRVSAGTYITVEHVVLHSLTVLPSRVQWRIVRCGYIGA